MSKRTKATKPAPAKGKIAVSVNISGEVVAAADVQAVAEERSRSFIFERALKRDLLAEKAEVAA